MKENRWLCLFYIGYFCCLLWLFFHRGFFVDELYDFHYYMQKTPGYIITTYIEPNNHVLFSLLGSIIWHTTKNPLLAVRGVSFLCAILNGLLLGCLLRKWAGQAACMVGLAAYAAHLQVNFESVQGRGYTMTMTFFLAALLLLEQLCEEKNPPVRYWLLYALTMMLGLFTVPTYLYAAAILCVSGGLWLLRQKRVRRLAGLAGCSLAGGVLGACCYLPIVLKAGTSEADGLSARMRLFQSAPMDCLKQGLEPLLKNRYVSAGMEGGLFQRLHHVWGETGRFLTEAYPSLPTWFTVLLLVAALAGLCILLKKAPFWGRMALLCLPTCMAVILVQGTFPFDRCLIYLAVPVCVGLSAGAEWAFGHVPRGMVALLTAAVVVLFGWQLLAFHMDSQDDGNLDAQILSMKEQLSQPCHVFIANSGAMLHLEYWKLYYGWPMELAYPDGSRFDYAVLSAAQNEPGGNLTWSDWYSYEELSEYISKLESIVTGDNHFLIYKAKNEQ